MQPDQNKIQTLFLRYGLWACVVALWFVIGLYVYLGVYSRYMADDYCETVRVTTASNPFAAVIERYMSDSWPRASMRYSNLLFTGFSEGLGEYAMQITMPAMILLWVIGLTLCMRELRKFFFIEMPIQADLFAGAFLAFLTILLAPNVFQLLYWRSAAMTHFAPLVLGIFLASLLLKLARNLQKHSPLVYASIFLFTFVIAGFSEPPATVMLTVFSFLIAGIFIWDTSPLKQQRIFLFASGLLGAGFGIITMLSSPAITPVVRDVPVNIVSILLKSFIYSFQFLIDTFKKSPLPILLALIIPLLGFCLSPKPELVNSKKAATPILALPFLLWLLVAASFAPSAYGQGFPAERARFLGTILFIFAIVTIGILIGFLLSSIKFKGNTALIQWLMLGLFVLVGAVYPLRRGVYLFTETLPEYRLRADQWDRREALILRKATAGETDLVIPGFSGIYGVKELDDRPYFWVNQCAAQIYGVNSIRTIGVDEEDLEYLLNE